MAMGSSEAQTNSGLSGKRHMVTSQATPVPVTKVMRPTPAISAMVRIT